MSDSESSSSDDELFSTTRPSQQSREGDRLVLRTTRLRALLKAMCSDIDEALESVQRVLKEAQDAESEDASPQLPLTQPAQEFFQLKQATKEELL